MHPDHPHTPSCAGNLARPPCPANSSLRSRYARHNTTGFVERLSRSGDAREGHNLAPVAFHLFFGHTSLSPPSSRPRFASRGEDSPQHPARQSDTALWVVRVGMVSVSATLSHPCLVWHTHLGHTGKVCHPHGRG